LLASPRTVPQCAFESLAGIREGTATVLSLLACCAPNCFLPPLQFHCTQNLHTGKINIITKTTPQKQHRLPHAGLGGPERTGVRLSPNSTFNDATEADPQTLYNHVLRPGPLANCYTVARKVHVADQHPR